MCIFCGGACGGAGDVLLPVVSVGIPLLALKIRAKLTELKGTVKRETDVNHENDIDENSGIYPD